MQKSISYIRFLPLIFCFFLIACSEEETVAGCAPINANDFGCVDPDDCLALKVSWNYPESSMKAGGGFDLSLWIDESIFVEAGSGGVCSHTGDTVAEEFEEQSETIVCDSPMDGSYRFIWMTYLITGRDARIDINNMGDVSCQFQKEVNVEEQVITIP